MHSVHAQRRAGRGEDSRRLIEGPGHEVTMKAFDTSDEAHRDDPQALPQFELEYLVDDVEHPSTVMVVPRGAGDRPGSTWISADIRLAVPLEWVR